MLEFFFELFGELLIEAICYLGDSCIQELAKWVREVL